MPCSTRGQWQLRGFSLWFHLGEPFSSSMWWATAFVTPAIKLLISSELSTSQWWHFHPPLNLTLLNTCAALLNFPLRLFRPGLGYYTVPSRLPCCLLVQTLNAHAFNSPNVTARICSLLLMLVLYVLMNITVLFLHYSPLLSWYFTIVACFVLLKSKCDHQLNLNLT